MLKQFRSLSCFSVRMKRAAKLEQLAKKGVYEQVETKVIKLDRHSMSPHEYWISRARGMERPFTGEYWFNQEVGQYNCRVCDNKLFSFDDKFQSQTGYASFWNHRPNSLELTEKEPQDDVSRHVCCSSCKSHVGKVYFDGPPPTFIRYQINSAALNFVLKPFFEDPAIIEQRKKEAKQVQKRDFIKEAQEEDIQTKN